MVRLLLSVTGTPWFTRVRASTSPRAGAGLGRHGRVETKSVSESRVSSVFVLPDKVAPVSENV